jgi:hypothetical protein
MILIATRDLYALTVRVVPLSITTPGITSDAAKEVKIFAGTKKLPGTFFSLPPS